jgi:ParB family chromosome partitioning protein
VEKKIAADFAVPCQVHQGNDATEISIAENAVRWAMHPADEFAAFKKLAKRDRRHASGG